MSYFAAVSPQRYANLDMKVWGPRMWQDMQKTANNFDSSFASTIRAYVKAMPCPECKSDSTRFMQQNPPENIKDKNSALDYICRLHSTSGNWSKNPRVNCNSQQQGRGRGWYYDGLGYARKRTLGTKETPKSVWAPKMWKEFNDLVTNFDVNSFAQQVDNLISQVPCADCKTDGESYIKTNPPESVKSKTEAQQWVKNYHSHVDKIAVKGWGFSQWSDLHEIAEYFDPDTFASDVYQNIDDIPPQWREHSLMFIRQNPPERVMTRSQAMFWMCRFHNWASRDAGNGEVDCGLDPEGYGYESGHRDYDSSFYYGGGRGGGGGRRGGGGGGPGGRGGGGMRHGGRGGMMQQQRGHGRRGGMMNPDSNSGYDEPLYDDFFN